MAKHHKLKIEKTAHYYTLGEPGPEIKRFWIICHGYGQRADRFLEQFKLLDDGTNFILAPEGLHRFYWMAMSGDVAASWMTKADRLDEIADYTAYIKTLYDTYLAQLNEDVEVILFGFSQGCATQCRWLERARPRFHHLVLWAGMLPEDIDYLVMRDYLKEKQIHFVWGDQDQFLKTEYLERHDALIEGQELEVRKWGFEGKHETRKKVLVKFVEEVLD